MEPQEQKSEQFPLFNLYPVSSGIPSNLNSINFNPSDEPPKNSLDSSVDKLIKSQFDEILHQDLNHHHLPLSRIKKIMKSDEDVRMISAETPAVFGKACELFIIELTHRAWVNTQESKRRTLQRSDIVLCIYKTDVLDFMQQTVSNEKTEY